ncbi:hypothetical protein KC675_02390 [Candidatus Dojkabacteria bacterium]|uniref:Uncharacterized protein n=1 Tax=Candidatus Dojkabacteria bacterium TaxID=2099670 RepID=A0A955I7M8_9BACT|nr:hypothetical protein [Candidatus Dojkabacteria bacterium]
MENLQPTQKKYLPGTIIQDGSWCFSVLELDYYPTGEQLVRLIGGYDEYGLFFSILNPNRIFLRDLHDPKLICEPEWTTEIQPRNSQIDIF